MVVEVAFLEGEHHVGFACFIEECAVGIKVVFDVLGVDEQVILVVANIFREITEVVGYYPGEHHGPVLAALWDNGPFEEAVEGFEGGLVAVPFFQRDCPEGVLDVMTGEVAITIEAVDDVHQFREGMLIVHGDFVEKPHIDGQAVETGYNVGEGWRVHVLDCLLLVLFEERLDPVDVGDEHDRISVVGIGVATLLRLDELVFLDLKESLFCSPPSLGSATHSTFARMGVDAEFEAFYQWWVVVVDMEVGVWVGVD
jgi:hypothetical protein